MRQFNGLSVCISCQRPRFDSLSFVVPEYHQEWYSQFSNWEKLMSISECGSQNKTFPILYHILLCIIQYIASLKQLCGKQQFSLKIKEAIKSHTYVCDHIKYVKQREKSGHSSSVVLIFFYFHKRTGYRFLLFRYCGYIKKGTPEKMDGGYHPEIHLEVIQCHEEGYYSRSFLAFKDSIGSQISSVPTGRDQEINLVYLGSDVVSKHLDFPKLYLAKLHLKVLFMLPPARVPTSSHVACSHACMKSFT